MTVVVWRDDGYGLIDWKQRNEFGRPFGVEFGNPDSSPTRSVRDRRLPARAAADLYPTLMRALEVGARRSSSAPSTTARTCA